MDHGGIYEFDQLVDYKRWFKYYLRLDYLLSSLLIITATLLELLFRVSVILEKDVPNEIFNSDIFVI